MATTETRDTGGVSIQTWVPVELAEQLKRHAESERRSVSALIRITLEDAVRRDREEG